MFHLLAQADTAGDAAAAAIVGGMFMVYVIGGIIGYVVISLSLMTIANKLGKNEKSWWAWIPILNLLLLAECAGHEVWMGLLCLIPVVAAFSRSTCSGKSAKHGANRVGCHSSSWFPVSTSSYRCT